MASIELEIKPDEAFAFRWTANDPFVVLDQRIESDERGAGRRGGHDGLGGTFLGRRSESQVTCTGFAGNKQLATVTTGGSLYLEVTNAWCRLAPAPG